MMHINRIKSSVAAMAAVAAGGLGVVAPAHADAQYKADRAYCMSGNASEARDLCLKEAAAAQADRQKGSHEGATHQRHRSAGKGAAAAPDKSASTP
jgi:hypothetical protein